MKVLAAVCRGFVLTLAVGLTSCAKFPINGGGVHTHLIITMTVSGHIQDGSQTGESPYVYIVAFNPSTDLFPTVTGPEPVIGAPWGNGFVAGNATQFVRYGLDIGGPNYGVYKFSDPSMISYGLTGYPVNSTPPGPNGSTIQFEVDMTQILPPGVTDPDTLQSVQINFLTMNRVPTGNDSGGKIWDALGDSRDPNSINDYVRIPLTTSRVFTNSDFQDLEPSGDTTDPNLDIADKPGITAWSVEVRKP